MLNGNDPLNTYCLVFIVIDIAMAVLFAIVAMTVYLTTQSSFNSLEGLGGIWQNSTNPHHTYQFLPNGKMLVCYQGIEIGGNCTWIRFENRVEVCNFRHDGDWEFTGVVFGNEIQGQFVIHDEAGNSMHVKQDIWRPALLKSMKAEKAIDTLCLG